MPLYAYACQTCELELEEMHPVGQAPEKSIRCPICGGYFERIATLFQVQGKTPSQWGQNGTKPSSHGSDCVCCFPTRSR